jgi:hypothetical protein
VRQSCANDRVADPLLELCCRPEPSGFGKNKDTDVRLTQQPLADAFGF